MLFNFSLAPDFSKLLFNGLLRVVSCFLFLSTIKFSPPFNVYTSRRFLIFILKGYKKLLILQFFNPHIFKSEVVGNKYKT
ncbi:hypothetical protein [Staphylococcus phage phiSa2wa-st2974]|nr:hypothetical protein [Staphylococcus phage phiSa2-NARSA676]UYE96118.1 hypothetical protein [Staphylococcus phage phiSa2wa-st2974]